MSPRRAVPPALYTKAPFLKDILEGMPESIKVIDDKFRVVYANGSAQENLGMSFPEMRGRSCHQAFYGFKEKCFFCHMGDVFGKGKTVTTYCTLAVNGVNREYEVAAYPLKDGNGKIGYAVEVVRDVTPLSKGVALPKKVGKLFSQELALSLVFDQMAQWAQDDGPVLIEGEKGTGKKLVAQALHLRGSRSQGSFNRYHCVVGKKSECTEALFGAGGLWKKTAGGTLYVDEISRLNPANQKMLLEKLTRPQPGDPRVIAATQQELFDLVHNEMISTDLYNRFAARVLKLPPLRERRRDLPVLAQHFVETCRSLHSTPAERLGPQALQQILSYSWPGNVRELEAQIERACLLSSGPEIEKMDLPTGCPPGGTLDDILNQTERSFLVEVLTRTAGDLAQVLKQTGLAPKTLQRKLKKQGLKLRDFRADPAPALSKPWPMENFLNPPN